jgi:hypothetical protein
VDACRDIIYFYGEEGFLSACGESFTFFFVGKYRFIT